MDATYIPECVVDRMGDIYWWWKCHKFTLSKHRQQPRIKGRMTWHEHILPITSSTCALRCFHVGDDKWRQMSLWTQHMGAARPPMDPPSLPKVAGSMRSTLKTFPTLRSHLCFLSRVEDQVTWIHGPTSKATRRGKDDSHFIHAHLHVGHASRRRVGPPTIGGCATSPGT